MQINNYPDFNRLADRDAVTQFKLLWDVVKKLSQEVNGIPIVDSAALQGQITKLQADVKGLKLAPDVAIPDHNDLEGLQGGAAGEYYHLTSAESALALDPPGAGLRFASNTARTASGSWSKMPFNTAIEDNDSIVDTVNSRLVCKTAGIYRVSWALYGVAAATLGTHGGWVQKNGAPLKVPGGYSVLYGSPSAAFTIHGLAEPVRLAVNDYIELYDYTSVNITAYDKDYNNFLSMQYVRP